MVRRSRIPARVLATLAVLVVATHIASASATAATFANPTPITVPVFGQASPYPSTITVSGLRGPIADLIVRLNGISHTSADDLDILLVPPRGKPVPLMSDVCGGAALTNRSYEFGSRGPVGGGQWPYMGNICKDDRYRPTNGPGNTDTTPDGWPGAPPGPYESGRLDHLHEVDPNGVWRLYVIDDGASIFSGGRIEGGWSLDIAHAGVDTVVPGTGTEGPAERYPITHTVTGETGIITDVDFSLLDIGHSRPDDLDLLLEGPGGQTVMLMSDACGGPDGYLRSMRWDDEAPAPMPDDDTGGCQDPITQTWRPTDHDPGDVLPAPAPAGPHGATLSTFDLTDPNGDWKLYVHDDLAGETGWIRSSLFARPIFTTRPRASVAFDVAAVTVPEGETGALTLTRTGPAVVGAGSVRVTSTSGSATTTDDFVPVSTVVEFAAAERTKSIPVTALADGAPEGAETFEITISEATGDAEIAAPAAATVTIPAHDLQGADGGGPPGSGGQPDAGRGDQSGTGGQSARPRLTALSLTPRTFRPVRTGAPPARRGTVVRYGLTGPATVRFSVDRILTGRRTGGRCRPVTATNRRRPRCARTVRLRPSLTRRGAAGANRLRFGGRLARTTLAPGDYRLTATPIIDGRTGTPRRATFTIRR